MLRMPKRIAASFPFNEISLIFLKAKTVELTSHLIFDWMARALPGCYRYFLNFLFLQPKTKKEKGRKEKKEEEEEEEEEREEREE